MSGYRGARGAKGGGNSTFKGSFLNGIWHCDCNPPLPAVHFPVKKEGPNKGRWFRTCQAKACSFFLWDSDASPRELAALSNNSRTEPVRAYPATPSRLRPQKPSPPPPQTPEVGPSASSNKRSRPNFEDDNDDNEFDVGGNAAFDEELDQVMTDIETPSKRARTDVPTIPLTTPARRKLPWQKDDTPQANMLHTPQTDQRQTRNVFSTPYTASGSANATRSRSKKPDPSSSQTLSPGSCPVNTPTPSRFKDIDVSGNESDLVRDIFAVLQEANIMLTDQAQKSLTSVLSKHAIHAKSVTKGRDVLRASIKAKDAKIAEMTYRVNTLEAELEAEKAVVKHLQWKAESGLSPD